MKTPRDDLMSLAPCPFCGGEATVVEIEPHSHSGGIAEFMPDHPGSAYIDCVCGVGIIDASKDDAIKRWNTRAASRPAPVDRETVARIIKGHVSVTVSGGVYAPRDNDRDGVASAADAILSLLRPAEPVEAKWRPIETAPKEDPERPGRDFEIIVGGGEIKDESADLLPWRPFDSWSLACYDSMRGCWRGEQTEQYDCFYLHKPTHWMPKFAGPGQCEPTTSDAVGEPVAWIITWSDGETSFTRSAPSASSPKNCKYQPLYTHPPKSPDTSAEEMREALLDATANLVGAASAYRKHAARHRSIGRAIADPFFTARAGDLEKAAERAQAAIRQLPTTDTSAAVLAERERCAAIADEWANKMALNYGRETANTIAAAIRQLPTTERGE